MYNDKKAGISRIRNKWFKYWFEQIRIKTWTRYCYSLYDTNIKLSCIKISRYIPGLLFRVTVPIFRNILSSFFLEAIKAPLSAEKNRAGFTTEMHKSAFLFLPFLRSDILDVVCGNNWTGPTTLLSGASRRQTKGDFLRASASLARGRWWEWQIAANFRCAFRIAGEIAEKCSRRDGGGEDFERDAYLWYYLAECKKSLHKLDTSCLRR